MPTPIVSISRKLPTKAAKPRAPRRASAPAQPHQQEQKPADGVLATTREERFALPMYQREDAKVLGGEALRSLGHDLGLPRSTLEAEKDDDRIRMEIRYIQQRKFDEDDDQ